MLTAVLSQGLALQYADQRLCAEREVVLQAVKSHCEALQHASAQLQAVKTSFRDIKSILKAFKTA